ncbi:MAG: thioredoxin domain-containing protein [bacterium]|nr:thioredoxin domain-containing protein [bacterium]
MKLVDYYADWCGPCQMMKPIVEEVVKELNGVTLEEVNVDEDQERAGKANVMSIPTFVIEDDNGVELDRKIGGLGKEDFSKWVSSYIK